MFIHTFQLSSLQKNTDTCELAHHSLSSLYLLPQLSHLFLQASQSLEAHEEM